MREHGLTRANAASLADALNTRFTRLSKQLRHVELPSGMTQQRLSTLATIAAAGQITVSALAESEQVRPATMSRMVSALVAEGLVGRDPNKNDARRVLVSLTPRGHTEFKRAQKFRHERLSIALASLPTEELALMQELAGALEKLSEILNGTD
jgi:DNA-binding MarR family transcriptional regulator